MLYQKTTKVRLHILEDVVIVICVLVDYDVFSTLTLLLPPAEPPKMLRSDSGRYANARVSDLRLRAKMRHLRRIKLVHRYHLWRYFSPLIATEYSAMVQRILEACSIFAWPTPNRYLMLPRVMPKVDMCWRQMRMRWEVTR